MRALVLAPLALLCLVLPASADDDDYHRLEDARRRGEIMSLTELLARLDLDGEVIEIEIDDDDGRIVYEIYYLAADGRRHEIEVDAATARILDVDVDDDDDDDDDEDDDDD